MASTLSGHFEVTTANEEAGTMTLTKKADPTLMDKVWGGFGLRDGVINTTFMYSKVIPWAVIGAGGYFGGQKHCRAQIKKANPSFNLNTLPKILGLFR